MIIPRNKTDQGEREGSRHGDVKREQGVRKQREGVKKCGDVDR